MTYAATRPRIASFTEAAAELRRGLRMRYRFYGVRFFLRVDAEVADRGATAVALSLAG